MKVQFSVSQLFRLVAAIAVCCAILAAFSLRLLVLLDVFLVGLVIANLLAKSRFRLSAVEWAVIGAVYLLLHLALWPTPTH
jgi:hypothetical protein